MGEIEEKRRTAQATLATVHAALAAKDIKRAISAAEAGLASGLAHPLLFNLAAHRRQVAGRFAEAVALLEQARRLSPNDVFILSAIGGCLSQQGLNAEALALYDQVLALNPRHAPAHHGRGLALSGLGELESARQAQLHAVELAPDYPDALGALADHAIRLGEIEVGIAYAERALAADPDEPAAILSLAFIDLRRNDPAAAAERLAARLARGGLAPLHASALESLYADTLDRLDQPEAALDAHVRSNNATSAVHAPLMAQAGVEPGTPMCRRLLAEFEAKPRCWGPAPGEAAEKDASAPDTHVFLIGFVRSGTTLLEQVLASHPRVVALEEQPILRGLSAPYFRDAAGLDALASLDEDAADTLRSAYWRGVGARGVDPAGAVFVDKNPLDGIWLPLVAKLFPAAKVLIARRDPRDVVVSSFRHRFIVNALTSAFTGLESAADFYSAVMALTESYRLRLPLAFHIHRHEDLVAEFDREVEAICGFLGLEWVDSLRDFAETAKRRDIRTPSADQVRQGLTRNGLGRWRRYELGLEPIMPILRPWVQAFGYDG